MEQLYLPATEVTNPMLTHVVCMCSVDEQTDAQMQEVIRTEFAHCTVLMIAHRLSGLRAFDRIAVIDKGRLVRFEEPAAFFAKTADVQDIVEASSSKATL